MKKIWAIELDLLSEVDRICKKYNIPYVATCGTLLGAIESEVISVPFEFMQIPVNKNFDNMLKKDYGNWHEFIVGSNLHGDTFFDAEHSYRDYI